MKCPKCQIDNPTDTKYCGNCATPLFSRSGAADNLTETFQMHPLRELATGTLFAQRYHVIENLGHGGMGEVYKVLDKEINEVVALKILKPEISADETIIKRFHNELRLARHISHKNVCKLYHLSKDERGTFYITMEYVPGEDLRSLICRIGRLTVGKAVAIAEQICDGLAEAHRHGVVHRDLKSPNIMIDQQGHVRIMDFGIARWLASKEATDPNVLIGTPGYMAPEQVDGRDVDVRTDVYALGIILYEMLTGRLPFEGDRALDIALKQRLEKPKPPKSLNLHVPESLNRAVLKCLEKKKEHRYQNAEELRTDLVQIEKAIRGTESGKDKERTKEKIRRVIRTRYRRLVWPVAAVLLIIGAWMIGRPVVRGRTAFDSYISFKFSAPPGLDIPIDLIEYPLLRALSASTRWNVLVPEDVVTYKKRTMTEAIAYRPPMVDVQADLSPKVAGFDIQTTIKVGNKTYQKTFDCKGYFDFLTQRVNDLHAFLAAQSGGIIGAIEGGRTAAQISTSSYDAMDHFLRGEKAWAKLDSETAFAEYRTALENDPEFSLAHLKMADVLIFRSERDAARGHLEKARAQKERLIGVDLWRLEALFARLAAGPTEERQSRGKLTEAFPFKKEYHYEFGESYFHYGDAEEAIPAYERALKIDDRYSLAHNHLAYCYSWTGDHVRALEHFQKYLELDRTANAYDSLATGYMFGGDCDRALSVLEEGLKLNANLDYLYGNRGRNLILMGKLKEAEAAFRRQDEVTTRGHVKASTAVWSAFIELLRGRREACLQNLSPAKNYFSAPAYLDRLDEAPNLPFWLAGVAAAQAGDVPKLKEEIARLEQKITRNGVSATNFSPILKFLTHLKMLEGRLLRDPRLVLEYIEAGKRMGHKMGYWGSLFNLPYFFAQYAEILLKMNLLDEAETILSEAVRYNPNYPLSQLRLGELYLLRGNKDKARTAYESASKLLARADRDLLWLAELDQLKKKF